MQFIVEHQSVILFALLSFSELLALIPSVKANSIFQLVYNGLKSIAAKADQKPK